MTFIPLAFADGSAAAGSSFDFMGFVPFLLIIGIMYFLLIRPQQKKAKSHQLLLKTLQAGDKVLTSSGIFGKIHKITNENEVEIEISKDVRVLMLRSSVAQIITDNKPSIGRSTPNKKIETVKKRK